MINPSECKKSFNDFCNKVSESLTDDIDAKLIKNSPILEEGGRVICNLHLIMACNQVYDKDTKSFFEVASVHIAKKLQKDYSDRGWLVELDYLGGNNIYKKPVLRFKFRG